MKGYEIAIFPREGEPTLAVLEPQFREAQRTAWNKDVRSFNFYHPSDPRPPTARSLDAALEFLREKKLTGRIAVELNQGSQICDRMVGEPTVYTQGYFDAFRKAAARSHRRRPAPRRTAHDQNPARNRAHAHRQ